jgi:hypothetical protein
MPLRQFYNRKINNMSEVSIADFTELIREADRLFETVGGSTRHYVADCLLPLMEEKGMKLIFTAGAELAGEADRQWISVKDRLPYKDGDSQIFCLVWDTYEGQAVVRPYNEYHKCWDDEDADDFYTDATEGNITHWQPLPQPPKSK